MNTIEFRVWNPTKKQMVYNATDVNLNNGVVAEVIKGQLMVSYLDETGRWKRTDFEIFTGLTDLNGKKIYIGDKTKFLDDSKIIDEVRYHEKLQVPVVVDADGEVVSVLFVCHHVIEVVGNIHEEE